MGRQVQCPEVQVRSSWHGQGATLWGTNASKFWCLLLTLGWYCSSAISEGRGRGQGVDGPARSIGRITEGKWPDDRQGNEGRGRSRCGSTAIELQCRDICGCSGKEETKDLRSGINTASSHIGQYDTGWMDVLVLPISEQTTVLVLPNMYRNIEKLTLCKIRARITVEVDIRSWHFIRLAPNVTWEVDIL